MSPPARRRHGLSVWLGPLVGVAGLVSYFTVFARFPVLRDVPWLNLPLVLIGVALSVHALRRRRSIRSFAGLAVSALSATLLAGYVWGLSSQLPATDGVVAVGAPAPSFALPDHQDRVVRLEDFAGHDLVLVFYRGFW